MPTFRLSQTEFDFGEVCYNRMVEAELCVINTGLVDVSFSLDLSKLDYPWILDVSKKTGHVPSRDKQKIGLRFRPGKTNSRPLSLYSSLYSFSLPDLLLLFPFFMDGRIFLSLSLLPFLFLVFVSWGCSTVFTFVFLLRLLLFL